MNTAVVALALPLLAALALLAAVARAWLAEKARAAALSLELAALRAGTEAERRIAADLPGQISAQAAQAAQAAAQAAADALLSRARESFEAQDRAAAARIETQLKPVAEQLTRFEAKVGELEKVRAEESGGLKAQIAGLLQASEATREEARKLSQALRRGAGVQGRWGEQTLRNVLETSGLTRFDFDEQPSVDTEEGRRRPDVTVRLPGGGVFIIDAKCSLTAFLESLEAVDDAARDAAMHRHAASLRQHVQSLAAKAYWSQFKDAPDFVAMFVPGDGFLAGALERQPDLIAWAMTQRVVIATPSTLFAVCKAVAYGWRVQDSVANAEEVAQAGRDLYKRLADLGGHAEGLHRAITAVVERFNALVGSWESRVLPGARRMEQLGVAFDKRVENLDSVAVTPRETLRLVERADAG